MSFTAQEYLIKFDRHQSRSLRLFTFLLESVKNKYLRLFGTTSDQFTGGGKLVISSGSPLQKQGDRPQVEDLDRVGALCWLAHAALTSCRRKYSAINKASARPWCFFSFRSLAHCGNSRRAAARDSSFSHPTNRNARFQIGGVTSS
jgi:hypothetical protein